MNSSKYIKDFDKFNKLNEQEADATGGADPFAAPADVPAAPAAAAPIGRYQFIFIDEGKKQKTYPGGGHLKTYASYEIRQDELEEWAEKHVENKKKRQDVIDIVAGRKFRLTDDERAIMRDFRKSVSVGHVASKSITVDVEFDNDNVPMTDNISITFIDTKK